MRSRLLLLFLIISLSFSQSSSIALRGLGEPKSTIDPASIALGGSQYFSGNSKQTSISSPSSFWRSALTRISMLNTYDEIEFDKSPLQKQHNFTYFGFAVPVGIKKVFSFGLIPATRINMTISEDEYAYLGADVSPEGYPIAIQSDYSFEGGISQFFTLFSFSLDKNLSFGLRWNFMFGTMTNVETSNYYSIDYEQDSTMNYNFINSDGLTTVNEFTGQNLLFEIRYARGRHEFVNSIDIVSPLKVTTHPYYSNSVVTDERVFNHKMNLQAIGVGYNFDINPNSGLILEYHTKNPVSFHEDVQIFNQPTLSEISINLGMFYRALNPRLGFWSQVNIRGGTYYKQYDEQFSDYGLTMGVGLEFLQNMNSVDISIVVGSRDSIFPEYKNENYMNITLGLTTGEKWFVKRRRK